LIPTSRNDIGFFDAMALDLNIDDREKSPCNLTLFERKNHE